jgi:hypothetical protein
VTAPVDGFGGGVQFVDGVVAQGPILGAGSDNCPIVCCSGGRSAKAVATPMSTSGLRIVASYYLQLPRVYRK